MPAPRVVVLDHASMQCIDAPAVRARPGPRSGPSASIGTTLPPSSPELNDIEPVFREVKHYDLPERRYPTLRPWTMADDAFTRFESRLLRPGTNWG
ncbi:MAG: hypothetical protein U0531_15470 [Dehalococcoidia bacterium]